MFVLLLTDLSPFYVFTLEYAVVTSIKKRDSRIVPFDENKIAQAVFKSASSQGGDDFELSRNIAAQVKAKLDAEYG